MDKALEQFLKGSIDFNSENSCLYLTKSLLYHYDEWEKRCHMEFFHDISIEHIPKDELKSIFKSYIKSRKEYPSWIYSLIDDVYDIDEILKIKPSYDKSKQVKSLDESGLTLLEYLKKYRYLLLSKNDYYLSLLSDYVSSNSINHQNETLLTNVFVKLQPSDINDICQKYPSLFTTMMPLKSKKWWLEHFKIDDFIDYESQEYIYTIIVMYLKRPKNVSLKMIEQATKVHANFHACSNMAFLSDDPDVKKRFLIECYGMYNAELVTKWAVECFPELEVLLDIIPPEEFKIYLKESVSSNLEELPLHV